MKIMLVIGTRPEAIKLAPVYMELKRQALTRSVETVVCATGQHREMLDQALALFGVRVDHDLAVMRPDQSLSQVAAAILQKIDRVLLDERPDWVVVQGDTTTVAAAALASFHARMRVAHVEAGLRTGDKWQPFPEEVNRKVATAIADRHFAPTPVARANLLAEGVKACNILVTGNPVIDAAKLAAGMPEPKSATDLVGGPGGGAGRIEGPLIVLVTAHRRENHGGPLVSICNAIIQLAHHYGDRVRFIYPVHLSPKVREAAYSLLGGLPNVVLVPPVDYLTLIHVLRRSHFVLTDSGGLQEEAPALGVPVLVLRDVTERPEAVDAGTVRLVGTRTESIVEASRGLLEHAEIHASMSHAVNPYGDGHASKRIVASLLEERVSEFVPDRAPGPGRPGLGQVTKWAPAGAPITYPAERAVAAVLPRSPAPTAPAAPRHR